MFSIKMKILSVLIILVSLQTFFAIRNALEMHAEYRQLQVRLCRLAFELHCKELDKNISLLQSEARQLAMLAEVRQYTAPRGWLTTWRMARRFLQRSPLAGGGGVWFEPVRTGDKNYVYLFRENDLMAPAPAALSQTYGRQYVKWYGQIKNAPSPRDVVWMPPYMDGDGTQAMRATLGCGIFDEHNELIGMVSINWELSDVAARISSFRPTPHSVVLFADLLHDVSLVRTDAEGKDIFGGSVNDLPWFEELRHGQEFREINGIRYLSFIHTMDNGMALGLNVPEKELLEPAMQQLSSMLVMIAVFGSFMLGMTYYLLNRFISGPLVSITREAEKIGHGHLNTHITIKDRGELGSLAAVLNRMTEDLGVHINAVRKMTQDKGRISAELDVATHIQASMLPRTFPPFPHRKEFDLHACMRPAREVGGDFYDFFLTDDDHLAFVMADVSGKGVPAAMFMVVAKTLLKNHLQAGMSPARTLLATNTQLCENNSMDMFVTAWIGLLEISTGRVVYSNAGHNPPLICRSKERREDLVPGKPGFVLAGLEDSTYPEEEIVLEPGDRLMLYTDGVTEAVNEQGELFGDIRLRNFMKAVQDVPLAEVTQVLLRVLDDFAGAAPQADDITLLILAYKKKDPFENI